jgi:hypothetical protein
MNNATETGEIPLRPLSIVAIEIREEMKEWPEWQQHLDLNNWLSVLQELSQEEEEPEVLEEATD